MFDDQEKKKQQRKINTFYYKGVCLQNTEVPHLLLPPLKSIYIWTPIVIN